MTIRLCTTANIFTFTFLILSASHAVSGQETKTDPPLPLTYEAHGHHDVDLQARSIRWNTQDFQIEKGIEILMNVIRDEAIADGERTRAVSRLASLGAQLRGRSCITELITLQAKANSDTLAAGLLMCLSRSQDPRSIPILYESSSSSDAPETKLFGTIGLATWNIRKGVEQLIDLFSLDTPGSRGALGWEAIIAFDSLNRRKGWGLPKQLSDRSSSQDQAFSDAAWRRELQTRYNDWFSANKNRFPDWKPGDPIPETEHGTIDPGDK